MAFKFKTDLYGYENTDKIYAYWIKTLNHTHKKYAATELGLYCRIPNNHKVDDFSMFLDSLKLQS